MKPSMLRNIRSRKWIADDGQRRGAAQGLLRDWTALVKDFFDAQ